MLELDPQFLVNEIVLTFLLGTLVVFQLMLNVIGFKLLLRWTQLRRLQKHYEQMNTAITLLTEATESGFRWTTAELQRVTSIVRRTRWPNDVQQRLEHAMTSGKTAQQIAGEEGLPESEVQLRMRLACAQAEAPTGKEAHSGAM